MTLDKEYLFEMTEREYENLLSNERLERMEDFNQKRSVKIGINEVMDKQFILKDFKGRWITFSDLGSLIKMFEDHKKGILIKFIGQ
jgi:hypothetical protein